MTTATDVANKPKCKFWDKCFRKNAAHLKQFLHPNDEKDDDTNDKTDTKTASKSVDTASCETDVKTATTSKEDSDKKKKGLVHDMSDSDMEDETKPEVNGTVKQEVNEKLKPSNKRRASAEKEIESPSKIAKTADDDDDASSSSGKSPRKIKCKYWNKCYQKNPAHRKEYAHPGDPQVTDDDDDDDNGIKTRARTNKPLHEMKDGEIVDFDSGYKIKRVGDHYTCSCPGWKIQKNSPDKRTCKHLKDYLGEEYEKSRTKCDEPKKPRGYIKPHISVSVLLAQKYNEETDNPTDWWMSEKLDGVRAYWNGNCFYSRLGNAFIAPEWFTQKLPKDMHLDGELFGGRGRFQSTVKIVKNAECDDWKKIKYFIFDVPSIGGEPFETRMDTLKEYFDKESPPYVKVVDHTKCTGKTHLDTELDKVLKMGGEGLMIRKPKSVYEKRRSYTLLKIKKFHDAEAIVIAHEPGKGKNEGLTGALRCRMECGKEFSVGSGLTDKDRHRPPKIGSIITYKFQELSDSGSPRFPVFLGIRIDMDAPKDAVLPSKIRDDV